MNIRYALQHLGNVVPQADCGGAGGWSRVRESGYRFSNPIPLSVFKISITFNRLG